MKKEFAKRVKSSKRSFVREILNVAKDKLVISFAGGLPDSSLFPLEMIAKEIENTIKKGSDILQYSNAQGLKELRVELAKQYTKTKAKNILITSGSQQALDILCKAFIDKNDTIITESPTYLAALNLFREYGASIKSIDIEKGVQIKKLEKIFKSKRVKFFYTIPTFQNPTGYSWSKKERKKVAKLAKKYNILIIEDTPYNSLRYEGKHKSGFDKLLPHHSITLGTFSKVLAPDFRIGWIRADEKFIQIFQTLKENSDLQSSKFFQYVALGLIKNGTLSKHTQTLQKEYRKKRDYMVETLKENFKDNIEFKIPKGGMFIWVKFKGSDTLRLFKQAINNKVAFVPAKVFYHKKKISSYARLNFTNSTFDEIKNGIKKLKDAYDRSKVIS